jgi:hypothetical protein
LYIVFLKSANLSFILRFLHGSDEEFGQIVDPDFPLLDLLGAFL